MDVLIDPNNPFLTILLSNSIELTFNIFKHNIERISSYNFLEKSPIGLSFLQYIDRDNILAVQNESYFLTNKTKVMQFSLNEFSNNLCGYIPIQEQNMNYIIPIGQR